MTIQTKYAVQSTGWVGYSFIERPGIRICIRTAMSETEYEDILKTCVSAVGTTAATRAVEPSYRWLAASAHVQMATGDVVRRQHEAVLADASMVCDDAESYFARHAVADAEPDSLTV